MGLDNGICVRLTTATNQIQELKRFNDEWDKELEYDFEICYYRKCWNIRYDILDILDSTRDYEFSINKDQIDKIIELFQSYNAENFEDNGSCIWEWDDEEWPYSEKIQQDIENLKYLRQLMDKYELEVYFYDSW